MEEPDRNRANTPRLTAQPEQGIRGHKARKPDRWVEADTGYTTPCWLWRLAKFTSGYGALGIGGRMRPAHRAYYEDRFGPIPDGLRLDHLCRVRCCVNPQHLEPVTHAENCRRGASTKLTMPQVEEIRASSDTARVIARRFGVSQGHVSRIRRGVSWRVSPTPNPASA
jgi:hypothetical protein